MKKLIVALFAGLLALSFTACGESSIQHASTGADSLPIAPSSQVQPSSQAESVIHGTIQDATMNTVLLDTGDGQTLSFATEGAEISAAQGLLIGSEINVYYTGQIMGEDTREIHVVRIENTAAPESGAASDSTTSNGSEYIGEDSAKGIVADQVDGATVENVYLSFDFDNGVPTYEGTLIHENMEYEFEVNAINGSILEWDVDSRGDG